MLIFLATSAVFALSYTQRPLYYSNQNHRFLHGLAHAGVGYLQDDWLANTADPTPIFSGLVEITARYLAEPFFYAYYAVLLGTYFIAMLRLAMPFLQGPDRQAQGWLFATLFLLIHSYLFRAFSVYLVGLDIGWMAQAGLAGQYLLGPMLQPSVVGALLIVSLAAFVHDRPYWAVLISSLAVTFHSTYLLSSICLAGAYAVCLIRERRLLSSICLAGAYAVCLIRERRLRTTFLVLALALVSVVPVCVYNLWTFGPSAPEPFARALAIMAHFRFPHHTEPERWFDGVAVCQISLVLLGIYWSCDHRLGVILLVAFLLTDWLTAVQIWGNSDSLAVLFPWRTSVWLVPVATAVILARFTSLAAGRFRRFVCSRNRYFIAANAGVVVLLVAGGIWKTASEHATVLREHGLENFVKSHLTKGQVWMIPPNLETFRLATGAPIVVDYKAHPYKDTEVLEWYDRLKLVDQCYDQLALGDEELFNLLVLRFGITHVVATSSLKLSGASFELIYQDEHYAAYHIRGSGAADKP